MRERSFQFFELLGRARHFDTGEISHLQHFLQQRTHIVEARWLTPPAPRVSQKRYRHCRVVPLKI
jgi:hypothetical protein